MRLFSWFELAVWWLVWAYPFIFRAPHRQKRASITVAAPTRIGLLLECLAISLAFVFRLPPEHPPGIWRIAAATICGPIGGVLAWSSVTHLGRQFRIHAGLYHDHALVTSGPYAMVRHPIYASLLALLLCTLMLLTPWQWMAVALAIFVCGTEIRVHSEEKLLAARFGKEFEAYRKAVPAYIPFVR